MTALIDISGSMSEYCRLILHFLHALGERRRVTTFLFGTRLTNVTRALKARDPDEALARCSAEVHDWSGGTRIAASLRRFNREWSRRALAQGAIVLLFTDGLEREGVETLGAQMERLNKSCRRLIWLNPLLRFDAFEPRAAGMRAMLPHVDEMRPIHNVKSMSELCAALAGKGRAAARAAGVVALGWGGSVGAPEYHNENQNDWSAADALSDAEIHAAALALQTRNR